MELAMSYKSWMLLKAHGAISSHVISNYAKIMCNFNIQHTLACVLLDPNYYHSTGHRRQCSTSPKTTSSESGPPEPMATGAPDDPESGSRSGGGGAAGEPPEPESLSRSGGGGGDGEPPETPTVCCMSGCANCVWIEYAERLADHYADGGEAARRAISEHVSDPSLRAFLLLELRTRRR